MAKRRMFSTNIIDEDRFLDMPAPTRLLYYDLGMRADDDGFISPKKVMRLTGSSDDDLKVLIGKGYIIPFQSGVIVIKDWKMNNYIQKDRYTETIYKLESSQLSQDANGSYILTLNAQPTQPYANTTQGAKLGTQSKSATEKDKLNDAYSDVYKMDTQVRLGKVSKNIHTQPAVAKRATSFKENTFPDGSTLSERFAQFWERYPRKIDKKRCEGVFAKKVTTPAIWESFQKGYKKYLAVWKELPKEEERFIPYPLTWLNGERWEDEIGPKAEVVHYLNGIKR